MARILILDDDFELSLGWRGALAARGHSVDLAYSSSEAVVYARQTDYDLYVIDLILQSHSALNDSGRLLLAHLRKEKSQKEIGACVIGISGLDTYSSVSAAQMLFDAFGVHHFLPKPFTPEELADLSSALLSAFHS